MHESSNLLHMSENESQGGKRDTEKKREKAHLHKGKLLVEGGHGGTRWNGYERHINFCVSELLSSVHGQRSGADSEADSLQHGS